MKTLDYIGLLRRTEPYSSAEVQEAYARFKELAKGWELSAPGVVPIRLTCSRPINFKETPVPNNKPIKFCDVPRGRCFRNLPHEALDEGQDAGRFIKVWPEPGERYNAAWLSSFAGCLCTLEPNRMVLLEDDTPLYETNGGGAPVLEGPTLQYSAIGVGIPFVMSDHRGYGVFMKTDSNSRSQATAIWLTGARGARCVFNDHCTVVAVKLKVQIVEAAFDFEAAKAKQEQDHKQRREQLDLILETHEQGRYLGAKQASESVLLEATKQFTAGNDKTARVLRELSKAMDENNAQINKLNTSKERP